MAALALNAFATIPYFPSPEVSRILSRAHAQAKELSQNGFQLPTDPPSPPSTDTGGGPSSFLAGSPQRASLSPALLSPSDYQHKLEAAESRVEILRGQMEMVKSEAAAAVSTMEARSAAVVAELGAVKTELAATRAARQAAVEAQGALAARVSAAFFKKSIRRW